MRSYSPRDTEDVFKKAQEEHGEIPDGFEGIESAVPKFTQVNDFTTFKAEWADIAGAFVIHFFMSDEVASLKLSRTYWQDVFPEALSNTAEEYFQATKPRVIAQYIPEMTSWYMRVSGFTPLAPESFLFAFFERLDATLDAKTQTS